MASRQDADAFSQENVAGKTSLSPSVGSPMSGHSRDNMSNICANETKSQEHSFLMDRGDVEQMEIGLLKLLDDFKHGQLHAFGGDAHLEQMNHIRDLQEKLSTLHFELEEEDDAGQRMKLTEDEQEKKSQQKLEELMLHLENLCSSVYLFLKHDSLKQDCEMKSINTLRKIF